MSQSSFSPSSLGMELHPETGAVFEGAVNEPDMKEKRLSRPERLCVRLSCRGVLRVGSRREMCCVTATSFSCMRVLIRVIKDGAS